MSGRVKVIAVSAATAAVGGIAAVYGSGIWVIRRLA